LHYLHSPAATIDDHRRKMELSTETNQEQKEEQEVVTPWEVSGKDGGKIDYDKLVDRFGCQRIDQSLIQR
ncbi:hypothetical protein RYX36_003646, partial [Vicia faba]